jgi:cyclic pyranopterin phosphate synthase
MDDSGNRHFSARVLTISSRVAAGAMVDTSGPLLAERLTAMGLHVSGIDPVPDRRLAIQKAVLHYTDCEPVSLLVLTGGTGPTADDMTPEALAPLLDRCYNGLVSAVHEDARREFPRAPLSRTIVGARGRTVILALPGSPGGVKDAMATLEPILTHLLSLTVGIPDAH